ncbi:hypothetical protein HDU82_000674 [Entophlyctis luteolus]|nr:hypothetical protein HDU82_000674 [Entophlyctis luteolus]
MANPDRQTEVSDISYPGKTSRNVDASDCAGKLASTSGRAPAERALPSGAEPESLGGGEGGPSAASALRMGFRARGTIVNRDDWTAMINQIAFSPEWISPKILHLLNKVKQPIYKLPAPRCAVSTPAVERARMDAGHETSIKWQSQAVQEH